MVERWSGRGLLVGCELGAAALTVVIALAEGAEAEALPPVSVIALAGGLGFGVLLMLLRSPGR